MNSSRYSRRADAFTLVELLCVLAIIGILAALLLPALNQGKERAKRIGCESNLHQAGIAFQSFMHDHDGRFPMSVSTNADGSQEFVQEGYGWNGEFYFSYRHFQTLASELGTPQILVCPADPRLPAAGFATLQNSNLSYFVGVKADFMKPGSLLAGDRNLTADSLPNPSILRLDAGVRLRWTRELHQFKGNLLFADGHVEEWNNAALASGVQGQPGQADLFLPSVPSSPNTSISGIEGHPSRADAHSAPQPMPPLVNRAPGRPGNDPSTAQSTSSRPSPAAWPDNHPAATSRFSAAVPAAKTISPDEPQPGMSAFDRHVAKILRGIIIGTYLLALLIFLLLLAYKSWQGSQRKNAPPGGEF